MLRAWRGEASGGLPWRRVTATGAWSCSPTRLGDAVGAPTPTGGVEAYALGALADVAVEAGLDEAGLAITELETIASRHGMRELGATAATLRARRGEPGALDTASLMASELDNPVVHERVTAAGARS
ncbi:MAG: hypothetical protein KY441_09900 [Actinobacteria bacterium]|nr:hypothetical protein [Actinomycetota bacterium]